MDIIFREQSRPIRIYVGKETVEDPYEKITSEVLQPPISIRAIVTNELPEKLMWKMPGIRVSKANTLTIRARHVPLIRLSRKIEIDGEDFFGYKDHSGSLWIRTLNDDFVQIRVMRD